MLLSLNKLKLCYLKERYAKAGKQQQGRCQRGLKAFNFLATHSPTRACSSPAEEPPPWSSRESLFSKLFLCSDLPKMFDFHSFNTSKEKHFPGNTPAHFPSSSRECSLLKSETQRAKDTSALSLVPPCHLSPLLPFWDRNAPNTFLTCSCHWHLEKDSQLCSSQWQSHTGSASHESHGHALQAHFCAQASSKCLVLNFKVITHMSTDRQTPESTELLPHIVWENTTQNGSKGGKMALRRSRQPRDPNSSAHTADSLLEKNYWALSSPAQLFVHGETTENPTHLNPPQESRFNQISKADIIWPSPHPKTGQALPRTHPNFSHSLSHS